MKLVSSRSIWEEIRDGAGFGPACDPSGRLGRRSFKMSEAISAAQSKSQVISSSRGRNCENSHSNSVLGGTSWDPGTNPSRAVRALERGRLPRCPEQQGSAPPVVTPLTPARHRLAALSPPPPVTTWWVLSLCP